VTYFCGMFHSMIWNGW